MKEDDRRTRFQKLFVQEIITTKDALRQMGLGGEKILFVLDQKEKLIGKIFISANKSIKTVLKIAGEHQTVFRTQPMKLIAGKKNFVAHYKENGCVFVFNVKEVFFSPRLATERLRIAKLILPEEIIGAFFAGVGPFPVVFAKNSQMKKAVAIELNPKAVHYLKKNIELNKVSEKIEVIQGDVAKIVKQKNFQNFFDRIVMPLPKNAGDFLDSAFCSIKRNGVIHFYEFVEKKQGFQQAIGLIEKKAKESGKETEMLNSRIIREISASRMQVVIDFKVK